MTVLPALFSFVASLLVLTSLLSWGNALQRFRDRQPLLEFEPRRTPPWNLIDVGLVFVLWVLLQAMVVAMLRGMGLVDFSAVSDAASGAGETASADSVALRWAIVLSSGANLVVYVLGAALIAFRTGGRWGSDLGQTLRYAGRDLVYGIIAFAMIAPIMYPIQLIIVQWYPSEHPLVESFRTNPTWGFYFICVFSAAVAAPLFEEFVCRVLLQGLFERVAVSASIENALFGTSAEHVRGIDSAPDDDPAASVIGGRAVDDPAIDPPVAGDPYASTRDVDLPESSVTSEASVPQDSPLRTWRGRAAIVLSSLVFSLMHWGNGLDPIPLFVLALGLGYLYQRTHRMLPSVVVHFLVNATALAMLAMSLATK